MKRLYVLIYIFAAIILMLIKCEKKESPENKPEIIEEELDRFGNNKARDDL